MENELKIKTSGSVFVNKKGQIMFPSKETDDTFIMIHATHLAEIDGYVALMGRVKK